MVDTTRSWSERLLGEKDTHYQVRRNKIDCLVHEDEVKHVARFRMATITVSSYLMEWPVLELYTSCIYNKELVAHTKVQPPYNIPITPPKAMRTNHCLIRGIMLIDKRNIGENILELVIESEGTLASVLMGMRMVIVHMRGGL